MSSCTGADTYTAGGLIGSSRDEPYDALVVARLKLAVSFEDRRFEWMKKVALAIERNILRLGEGALGAEATCTLAGETLRARLVISPA